MSGGSEDVWNRDGRVRRSLYRDRENGWIFGVCAGLSDRFGVDLLITRIIAVVSLLCFFIPTALAYLAAVILVPERPLIYRGVYPEQEFWRGRTNDDRWRSR